MAPAYEDRSIAFTRIGQMRVQRNLTQQEVYERSGISVPVLQRLEAGRNREPRAS